MNWKEIIIGLNFKILEIFDIFRNFQDSIILL